MELKKRKFTGTGIKDRPGRLNLPARASLYYTAAMAVSRGAAFICTPIFTRLMPIAEYGAYSLFNSYLSVIAIIGSLEIPGSILFRLFGMRVADEEKISAASALLISVFTAAVALGFGIFGEGYAYFIPSLIIASVCRVMISLFTSGEKYRYRYGVVCGVMLIEGIVPNLITLIVFQLTGRANAPMRVWIFTAILAIIAIPIYIYTFRKAEGGNFRELLSIIPTVLKTALPRLPYYISLILIPQGAVIIIGAVLGEGPLAKYSVAYSLGSVITMLTSGITAVLTPWIMRKARCGALGPARGLMSRAVIIMAAFILVLLCICPELMSFLAPVEYYEALATVFPIMISAIPLFLTTLTHAAGMSLGEGAAGSVLSGVITAVISIVLNIFSVRAVGFFASGLILLFSYSLLFIMQALVSKRQGMASLMPIGDYLILASSMLLISYIIYLLSDTPLIRAALMLIFSAVFLYYALRSREYIREIK